MTIAKTPILVGALLLWSAAAGAQATRLIDPLDPVYQDLEQLIDNRLIDRLSLGQRPISRSALAKAVDEAARVLGRRRAKLPPDTDVVLDNGLEEERLRLQFLDELIASLRSRFELTDSSGPTLPQAIAPVRSVTLYGTRTNAATRLVPVTNGLGSIDARLNPLLGNWEGRAPTATSSALLETFHTLETHRVAFVLTPQVSLLSNDGGSERTNLRVQELQFRLRARNAALDIGREYIVWGQGRDNGLLNSTNSPPLDLIKISSEEPFELPWILRGLGPTRLSLFVATLGADQNFPHPYMVAYRASVIPRSFLELGASVYTKSGGTGAPPATTTARLVDLLPFLDASAYNNVFGTRGDFQFSDHYAGLDGRFRLPNVVSSIYWEILLNDFDIRRLSSVFWDDAGHVFGLELPPLLESRRLRTTLEYHHTGLRYYEHDQFTSGQTLHHLLTGDPLGPNGQGGYVYIDWYAAARRRVWLELALERRSDDQYSYVTQPAFAFRLIEERPKELRARAITTWQLLPDRGELGSTLQLGYERTRNFDFTNGDDRNGFLARLALQYRFR